MGADRVESTRARSIEKQTQDDDMPMRERWNGEYDAREENRSDEVLDSGKHRDKDPSKTRRDEREHRSRDRERLKAFDGLKEREKEKKDSDKDRLSRRDRRKEDTDEIEKGKVRDKDYDREKHGEKEKDRERKDRSKEKDRERDREKELETHSERGREERGKEKSRDKDKDREKERDRAKDRGREKHYDREKERENDKHRGERETLKERKKEKEKQADQEKDRARDRDRSSRKQKDESHDMSKDMEKDGRSRLESDYSRDYPTKARLKNSDDVNVSNKKQEKAEIAAAGYRQSASELEERVSKMREERLKSSEGASEVLAWVSKSRKLEEKRNTEKEKARQLSKIFEEQDTMIDEESDSEAAYQHITHDLEGVRILDGVDKVLEGGAVVLTLKDQSILADGDINQEVDMLENVEIGEQKRRNEAYKAAKKKTGIYDDKFSDEPGADRKMLPQYDDPVADEGVTLDSNGQFTGEAETKLEELRKRIQGVSASVQGEDLNTTGKISSDYYTQEEMTTFKKPKKKKSLRKKEKLDLDALEAEAISAGLGSEDLGSRDGRRRQNLREEKEWIEAEKRANAYQSAYAKAEEASKALRQEQMPVTRTEEDDTPVFGDDDDDELRKSLERARKVALKKREEEKSAQEVVTLSSSTANDSTKDKDNPNLGSGEQPENKVVFTEMEEFVWGLQLDEEEKNPESEDVFMEEDVAPSTIADQEMKGEDGGWSNVKETVKDETPVKEEEKEVVPDETIHEAAVGKGLAGALKFLKERGSLKETVEWGGRHTDKKKSKLIGLYDNDAAKEIRIERTDEYGRILTPKEAFRRLSHSFHGKGPGKMKQEKRMRQYQEELKVKQMENADTPSQSVGRMREAQAKLQTPYLVLSGHVRHGQSSDPSSGFATVERNHLAGGLTPMLGDKKVEHFLNIRRKFDSGDDDSNKKRKT
ncbi:hypothetical protein OROHE_006352 [Orobanche hederae]